jgi:hypothetical protein
MAEKERLVTAIRTAQGDAYIDYNHVRNTPDIDGKISTETNTVKNWAIVELTKVNTNLSKKVDKVDGKDLSTNDYTNEEKSKLESLEKYELPVGNAEAIGGTKSGGDVAINEDGTMSISKLPSNIITTDNISNNAVTKVFEVTIPKENWQMNDDGSYSKTVDVVGIEATDRPVIDIVPSSAFTVAQEEIVSWGYVYKIVAAKDKITAYAFEKPSVDLTVQMEVHRK